MIVPHPFVQSYEIQNETGVRRIEVVRDDLLVGGTKEAALGRVLPLLGGEEYVYAGPRQGYAQVALAHCCQALGKKARLFVAASKTTHARTAAALEFGAVLEEVRPGYLAVVQARAREYCRRSGAVMMPFGLDCESIVQAICERALATGLHPTEVWSVAGSGTLQRGLQRAWPSASFYAVQVGKTPRAGRAHVFLAPEKYEQAAKVPPPFPSCSNYDAKAWAFIVQRASNGAVFWNVAR